MRVHKEILLERESKVWELRQCSWTQERIAAELGLNQSTVSRILARTTKRYAAQFMADVARVKAEQVAQLENIAYEAWQAWDRSKEPFKASQRKTGGRGREETILRIENRDGDPRHLLTIIKALADIRTILGLDEPVKPGVGVNVGVTNYGLPQEFVDAVGFIYGERTNDQQAKLTKGEKHEQ